MKFKPREYPKVPRECDAAPRRHVVGEMYDKRGLRYRLVAEHNPHWTGKKKEDLDRIDRWYLIAEGRGYNTLNESFMAPIEPSDSYYRSCLHSFLFVSAGHGNDDRDWFSLEAIEEEIKKDLLPFLKDALTQGE